jgi:TM2 domain-containing membrane protein YozV
MSSRIKDRKVAAILAFSGILLPGLHKFYLGQPRWGIAYLLLSWTPIPKVASALEGLWYLFQDREEFEQHFNNVGINAGTSREIFSVSQDAVKIDVSSVAEALRQVEQLRQEGLISEGEFEQKRRQLVERLG